MAAFTPDPATRAALAQRDFYLAQARHAVRVAREIEKAYNLPRVELANVQAPKE